MTSMATMSAYATSYKPLLSARSYVASSLKRRRHVVCIRNSGERQRLHHSFSACIVGVSDSRASALNGHRNFHSSQWYRISPKALPSCDRYCQTQALSIPLSPHPRLTSARYMSSHSIPIQVQESSPPPAPSALENLEFRVSELERASQLQRLTKNDVQHQLWPLLVECAPTSSIDKGVKRDTVSMWMIQERLERAKLGNRILELCLKEVESRRVFLWEWLQNLDANTSNNNDDDTTKFSPTAFWSEVPHPKRKMFTLVISSWKHVIESCSSFSIKSLDAMELMESSAQQASSILSLMEDEHSSDVAFVETYNSQVDKSSYTLLVAGASSPDVRNYSEVIETWGQCIDGSALRLPERRGRGHHPHATRDGAFQKRLQLEASAMKSLMKYLEFMEADLYEDFSTDSTTKSSQRKRPPPDRICYNIILASMARQVNPSLYEMRLVLQRMMERVQYELEYVDNETDLEEGHEDDHFNELAMAFFPDVFSYNALIEARANRSAMFASDSNTKQQQQQQFSSPRFHVWQQGQSENLTQKKRRYSSSEEEAILAEHTVEEMSSIVTVSVRPNIWSYNAVIKGWLKTDSERGLQRAVMFLRALALNGHNIVDRHVEEMDTVQAKSGDNTNDKAPTVLGDGHNRVDRHDEEMNDVQATSGDNTNAEAPTLLGRIAHWGASLIGKDDAKDDKEDTDGDKSSFAAKSRSDAETEEASKQSSFEEREPSSSIRNVSGNQSQQTSPIVGMASPFDHIHYKPQESKKDNSRPHRTGPRASKQNTQPFSIGMTSRMALINSAMQGGQGNNPSSSIAAPRSGETENMHSESSEPIGPLPNIEANVSPDLKTFSIVISALERRGTATSAKLAEDLLHLLEEYYSNLDPDITIYHSALNAWAKAAKETSDARACLTLAQKADELLCKLLEKEREESGMFPQPNEYSFLMAINAWANAASAALSDGNISDGKIAAEHAESLLNKLQKQTFTTNKTTIACYGAVIRTWASVGQAQRAQTVLDDMVEISERIPLDLIHFNAVLDAWARDLTLERDLDKIISRLSSIHDLLMKMDSGGYQSYNVDPDTSSFNHVIRACYAPWTQHQTPEDESTRQKALEIAYDSYSRMSQDYNSSHRPDAHTYAHMFKAIACLLASTNASDPDTHSKRYSFCKTILQACCRDGHLAKSSVWTLRKMFPVEDDLAELLLSQMDHQHGNSMTKEKLLSVHEDSLHACLPAEWSRHGRKYKGLNRRR